MSEQQAAETVAVDFAALLDPGDTQANEVAGSPLETALAEVPAAETTAVTDATPQQAQFQFRSLLTDKQRDDLAKGAPVLAGKFTADVNQIVNFGGPIMKKMNDASVQLLEAQRHIKVPEADQVVNDMLREMDGFEKKWRSVKLENAVESVRSWFKRQKYTLSTMVRESKPIADKIDLAELKLQEMETALADNISRGQLLHKQTLSNMDDVVAVLAALEQVIEELQGQFDEVDTALRAAESSGGESATYKGESVTVSKLREIHSNLSFVLSETEKTWADWRSQFFLGFAHAPATRNLVVTTFSLRRRLAAFRTMGLPAARQSLALWQQAAFAKEGAQLGESVQAGTNKLIQRSFEETAKSVEAVANAAQAPVITEETIWSVIDSVKAQCSAIVTADKAGRALRARNLDALERGETQIQDAVIASQRQVADGARSGIAGAAAAGGAGADGGTGGSAGTGAGDDLLNKLTD
ncbi:toxic anion resistance protein [Brevibacterium sp. 91QC2O2]|uniref:toxic anion resistance protein n=1 Tax=Brevibacterium sp. 91QC2O2 TaxID=2968458 RepID=UPI00211C6159|nr:toxic anion resistance protein [Brevibacterium sp. 91QC2O2]MCQ9369244.1 toxic anion resistance protein [Brevibacterium sp. 91QC2O2]